MHIILIGYMTSGKSTIGKLLAESLKRPFIDLDQIIEEKSNSSISNIFEQKGEFYFRKLEHQTLQVVLEKKEPHIIALGGGTPCYYNNMDLVNKNSDSFYLLASVPELLKRLAYEKQNRPLVVNIPAEKLSEFIGKHLFERQRFYTKAKNTIVTDRKAIEIIVKEILKIYSSSLK